MVDPFDDTATPVPAQIEPVLVRMLSLHLDAAFMTLEAKEASATGTARMVLADVRHFSGFVTSARAIRNIAARAHELQVAIDRFSA